MPRDRKSRQSRTPSRQGVEVKWLLLKEAKGGACGELEGGRSSPPQACPWPTQEMSLV